MNRLLRVALLCALGGAVAAGAEESEGPLLVRVSESTKVLVWDRGYESGSCWFVAHGSDDVQELGCGLAGMHQVSAVVPSPDRRWLAVVSAGEGHPLLEVVDLQDLVASRTYRVVTEIEPYPGAVGIERWNETGLVVSSDMPLDRLPLPEGADVAEHMFRRQRRFIVELETWQVRLFRR